MFLRRFKPWHNWVLKLVESSFAEVALYGQQLGLNDISAALLQFKQYRTLAMSSNKSLFQRTNMVGPINIDQLNQIRYFDKLQAVEAAISTNADIIDALVHGTLQQLVAENVMTSQIDELIESCGLQMQDGQLVDNDSTCLFTSPTANNNHRVVEAVSHLCRDWSPQFDSELQPLLEFVLSSIDKIKSKAPLVVVPGPGVGRVPYEIAKSYPTATVESIEWSTLMYICNQFALSHKQAIELIPFAQHYSSQTDADTQLRKVTVPLNQITNPTNLKTLQGDFREYISSSKAQSHDVIVVVTVYFIDTAENLFEYIESIEQLKRPNTELHWINIGPMKYGTRPVVQLTCQELQKLRHLRGWKDLKTEVNVTTPHLNGYLTDTKSLYQGYYGLNRFHSTFNPQR